MAETEYSKKLKDPRWQKKRLEILQRDDWKCQKCFDTENTLAIHHRRYLPGKDPWEYPDEYLITLCEECHTIERETRQDNEEDLLAMLRLLFFADDIETLTNGFHQLILLHSHEVVASVYAWALFDSDIQKELIEKYFQYLRGNHG